MEQQSNNKRFIKQDFDKFNNKSTSELVWPTKFSKKYISIWWNAGDSTVKDYKGMEIDLTLRHVKTPDIETCLIDYMYLGGDWMFLRNGNMIINLDGTENIKLEAKESNTDVGVGFRNAVCEIGFYSISKEELKKFRANNGVKIIRALTSDKQTNALIGIIITELDNQPVSNVADVRNILNRKDPSEPLSVTFVNPRGEEQTYIWRK